MGLGESHATELGGEIRQGAELIELAEVIELKGWSLMLRNWRVASSCPRARTGAQVKAQ
jgi:hypothetical protein